MKLNELNLLTLQSNHMKSDKTTKALCEALTSSFKNIDTNKSLFRINIESLSEDVLDELALEKNIFWYDPKADIQVKRNLIRNADKVFKYLGTNYAIEQVVQDYFGDGEVEEWYEYGSMPYHFRVVTSNTSVTGTQADMFNEAVEKIKRKSTRLEEVLVALSATFDIFYGFVIHVGDNIILRQEG